MDNRLIEEHSNKASGLNEVLHEEPLIPGDKSDVHASPPLTENRDKTGILRAFAKRARDHFFDFILLFLAVFYGFMADNWRETLSEQQREKIFIRSIVEDVISDTLESHITLNRLRSMNAGIDSVLAALLDPYTAENSNEVFYRWIRNQGLDVFVSNDRTITDKLPRGCQQRGQGTCSLYTGSIPT